MSHKLTFPFIVIPHKLHQQRWEDTYPQLNKHVLHQIMFFDSSLSEHSIAFILTGLFQSIDLSSLSFEEKSPLWGFRPSVQFVFHHVYLVLVIFCFQVLCSSSQSHQIQVAPNPQLSSLKSIKDTFVSLLSPFSSCLHLFIKVWMFLRFGFYSTSQWREKNDLTNLNPAGDSLQQQNLQPGWRHALIPVAPRPTIHVLVEGICVVEPLILWILKE